MNRFSHRPVWETVVGTLFSSGCIIVGVWVLLALVAEPLCGLWRTRDEITVEALVQSAALKRGGKRAVLKATYSYVVAGNEYTGSRVTLFGESRGFYHELRDAEATKKPIRVFIDPSDPSFTVFNRKIFTLHFTIAVVMGSVFLFLGIYLTRLFYLERSGK